MKHLELSDAPPDREKDKKHLRKFVVRFLRPDGVFILRMVAAHAGTILSTELVYSLWLRYRETLKTPKVVDELPQLDKINVDKLHQPKCHSSVEDLPEKRFAHSRSSSKDTEEMPWAKIPSIFPMGNHKAASKGKFVPEEKAHVNFSNKSSPIGEKVRSVGATDDEMDDDDNMHYP